VFEEMAESKGLSELGVLVAQLESVVHSGSHKPLQPLMCFDLLSDLLSTLERASKVHITTTTFSILFFLEIAIFGAFRSSVVDRKSMILALSFLKLWEYACGSWNSIQWALREVKCLESIFALFSIPFSST
jgi:hypothetical protein